MLNSDDHYYDNLYIFLGRFLPFPMKLFQQVEKDQCTVRVKSVQNIFVNLPAMILTCLDTTIALSYLSNVLTSINVFVLYPYWPSSGSIPITSSFINSQINVKKPTSGDKIIPNLEMLTILYIPPIFRWR